MTVKTHYLLVNKNNKRIGFFLTISSLLLLFSLISYDAADACLNVINNAPIKNVLGKYGAIVADAVLQSIGFSAYILAAMLFYGGIIMLQGITLTFMWLRVIALLICLSLTSFLFGCFSKYNFKYQMLPGGYIGFYLHDIISEKMYLPVAVLLSSTFVIVLFLLATFSVSSNKKGRNEKKNKKQTPPLKLIPYLKSVGRMFSGLINLLILFSKFLFRLKILRATSNKKLKISPQAHSNNAADEFNRKSAVIDATAFVDNYIAPDISLLKIIETKQNGESDTFFKTNMMKLAKTLGDFGVRGDMIGFRQGPVVSLYEFKPYPGVKSSRVIGLADDIARTMMVTAVRIATIPGKDTIGIEMPNKERATVSFRSLIECKEYQNSSFNIPLILGCDIFGSPVIGDLTTMPHLLIAGTTGSGKSVGVNGMILSALYKLSPQKCKFIMIDPKMLEFSMYNHIPHLLMPVITEARGAVLALKWVVKEMENRYRSMSTIGVRNIYGYNEKVLSQALPSEQHKYMPFIVVIIDEMADLMVVAGKEVEVLVQRLSQMARAAGIHLIMATQRPSVDVITGVIKANFPTRISYQVTSKVDSRTILGEQGAEQLLGKGDMLYMVGGGKTVRVHGPFVSDGEVEVVSNYLKSNYQPSYITLKEENIVDDEDALTGMDGENFSDGDLYAQALRIVMSEKKTSISYIQRKLRIGYNKAANLIEQMEERGVLSAPDNTGKRMILGNENE